MSQGVLPIQYEEENRQSGSTALAGLPIYMDLATAAGLRDSIERHVEVAGEKERGWTLSQMVMTLFLLNIAGGNCVDDVQLLEDDEGFARVLRQVETHGMKRAQRRALEKRRRKEQRRAFAAPSVIRRDLERFHDEEQEKLRKPHKAFIPQPNEPLRGLVMVNGDLMSFAQSRSPQTEATLDQDATLIDTNKQNALFCYKGFKAYQPLNTYWAEQGLVLHSEFRDGNVPAGYEQLRVLKESLMVLPEGVVKVYLRSDTAGYQVDLLKYCAEGHNERFGVLDFAIGVDVTPEFKHAVAQVAAKDWHPLRRMIKGKLVDTDQQWAEVCFVPNWIGHSKKGPDYRYLAIREPLQQELPGIEAQQSLPFPTMEFAGRGKYKVFGVVTNRHQTPGEDLIWWHRKRCGKSEEVHAVMKDDLAGGKLPSAKFGANAAWWAIMILSVNLNTIMQRLVLGGTWVNRRMKAMRFGIIRLAGWVHQRSRTLRIRLSKGHSCFKLLLEARRRIQCLANAPPG